MIEEDFPSLRTPRELKRRAAMASDPGTPLYSLAELARSHPALVVVNPAFELALVGDPSFLREFSATALAGALKCREVPPMALEMACADRDRLRMEREDLERLLAEHPHSSSYVIDRLDEAGYALSRFHVRSRHAYSEPWEEAALGYLRRTDRSPSMRRCVGLGARLVQLGMYPLNNRFSVLLADRMLERCKVPIPDWRPETCALLVGENRTGDPARTLFATGCLQKPPECRQSAIHGSMSARIALAVNPSTPVGTLEQLAEHDHQWPVVAAAREALANPGRAQVPRAIPVPRIPVRSNIRLGSIRAAFNSSTRTAPDLEARIQLALLDRGACSMMLAGGSFRSDRFQIEPETFFGQLLARQREWVREGSAEVIAGAMGRFIAANLPYALPLLG